MPGKICEFAAFKFSFAQRMTRRRAARGASYASSKSYRSRAESDLGEDPRRRAGDVGHVDDKVRTEFFAIPPSRAKSIWRGYALAPATSTFGLIFSDEIADLIVIEAMGLGIESVRMLLEQTSRKV